MQPLENMVSLMKKSMKNFQELLEKRIYVDDLNCGNVEEGFDLYQKMKFRLDEANFVIRK